MIMNRILILRHVSIAMLLEYDSDIGETRVQNQENFAQHSRTIVEYITCPGVPLKGFGQVV